MNSLDSVAEDEGRQPCGLDCTELEQERVLEVGFFHFCNGYVLSKSLRHDWLTLLFLCSSCAGSFERSVIIHSISYHSRKQNTFT
jgi:hypothetical protein